MGNGALDFVTEADEEAPTVVDSNPSNGQVDVAVGRLGAITVEFSEPMDTSIRTVSYSAGTGVGILTGNWNASGTVITFPTRDRVVVDAEHRIDLSPFRDEARNLLDGTVGLDEGELVFSTSSADSVIPVVVFTSPPEGATDVSTRVATLEVLFSEAMDETVTSVTLSAPSGDILGEGTWNAAGTELTVPLDGLASNETYQVVFTGFTDLTGNPVDETHPYLGDGILTFTTGAPTGETCRDPLTASEGTLDGTTLVYDLPAGAFAATDNDPGCTWDTRHDGVIEYVKTTGDLASGGTALQLSATASDTFAYVVLEVYRDVCDSEAVGGGFVARESCLGYRHESEQFLDVPAGTYYIWIGAGGSENSGYPPNPNFADFSGAEVRIDEVSAIPEGESCADPYDAGSSIYSSMGTDAHRWVVPGYSARSVDYGTSSSDDGSMSCQFGAIGPDVVIEVPKARAGSILDVSVVMYPGGGTFGNDGAVLAMTNLCEVGDPGGMEVACPGAVRSGPPGESFQFSGDAGNYYLWVAADANDEELLRATVDVVEVDPGMGETCGTAIPLAPGSNAITPDAATAFFTPSCIDVDPSDPEEYQAVTWYRFTTTEELAILELQGTAQAPLAVVDATTGDEAACLDEAIGLGVPQRVGAGREVCIAVPSTADVTGITIEEMPWQGIDGSTVTDLGILPPLETDGDEARINLEAWLEVTPTQLYMGISVSSTISSAIVSAPRGGGARAELIPVDRYQIGNGAAAIGEALWTIDETNGAARPERLFRLVDSAGTMLATPWDTGSAYILSDIDTLTKVVGQDLFLAVSDDETGQPPTVYAIPSDSPGAATILAEIAVDDPTAIAATADWLFVGGSGPDGNSFYRIPRTDLATATPELLAPADLVSTGSSNGSMVYDETTDTLYFRSYRSPYGIYAVFDATSANPVFAGAVSVIGGSSDYGLAIDKATQTLFAFETETDSNGVFVSIQ